MKFRTDKKRAEYLGKVWYIFLKRPKNKLLHWFYDSWDLGKVVRITNSQGKNVSI